MDFNYMSVKGIKVKKFHIENEILSVCYSQLM